MLRFASVPLLVLFAGALVCADSFKPATAGKKLIEYGWDCPDTAFVRQHIREMENRPFDGLVIRATFPPEPGKRAPSIGRQAFSQQRYTPADYQHCIDDLKATHFEKFTDNFIQVVSGDIDFFDDWESVLHNISIMAKIAREGGCVGLMLDPEQYGANRLWTYQEKPQALRDAHSLQQYVEQAHTRGKQFMQAINREFPAVRILMLFGPSLTYDQHRAGLGGYSLLAPFVDGMCQAADKDTQITDGYEQSYSWHAATSFATGRKTILDSRAVFEDKQAFDRVMRVGFGLWLDFDSGKRGWHPDDYAENLFSPATWQSAVHNALAHSDGYVWIYSERFDWWTGEKASPDYEKAQRAGRLSPASQALRPRSPTTAQLKYLPRAAKRQDPDFFNDLLKTHDILFSFPAIGWLFRPDPDDIGIAERWFAADLGETFWSPIRIEQFWEEQGWDYDGYGWYRATFVIPSIPPAKQVLLVIGAADESADIWLNGNHVGSHDIGENGWDRRFSLDITDQLREGLNQITLRVLDCGNVGGLWRPIRILAARQ